MNAPQWLLLLLGAPSTVMLQALRRGAGVFRSHVSRPSGPSGEASALRWREQVRQRLAELCDLPSGWDGYDAGPVNSDTSAFAWRLLDQSCPLQIPPPSIVPGVDGDLQIEWHLVQGDVELHVRSPNDVIARRETAQTGEDGEEVALTHDFTRISVWLRDLVEPARALATGA